MKRLILCAAVMLCGLTMTTTADAQQKVIPAQCPTINAGGDFNNGTGDTAVKNYTADKMPLTTAYDTVVLAASAGDSAREKIIGEYNSVTLEAHGTIYSGTACDSVTVTFWATATPGNGQGSFIKLQSYTLAASTNEQVFQYLPANGIGNPQTNYRISWDVADLAGTCKVSTKNTLLVR